MRTQADMDAKRENVERIKGKLMEKAAAKRAQKESGADGGVETARRRYQENKRLQGVG